MTDSAKFRFILHLISSGVELAISVRGQDTFEQACDYLEELLGGGDGSAPSRSKSGEQHFLVDDSQLDAFRKFLRKLNAE
ncbi:MAG: hypothetical protein ABL893_13515 [Hyphomicrobium sp.]|nr:hypothetical protein [Hyphomicrobium sp.]